MPIKGVMKILFVHPDLRAGAYREPRLQAAVDALRARGASVLLSSGVAEAFQVLQFHGRSIDLAIVHREGHGGSGDPGLALLRQIRAVPAQQDLPLVVTTQGWTETECARHQASPEGAHAYFLVPSSGDWNGGELCSLVNAVTAGQLDEALHHRKELQRELESSNPPSSGSSAPETSNEPKVVPLRELSEAFERQAGQTRTGLSIQLELPPLESSESPAPVLETIVPVESAPIQEAAPLELVLESPGQPVGVAAEAPSPLVFEPAPAAPTTGIEAVSEDLPEAEVRSEFPYLFSGSTGLAPAAPERGTRWESLPPVGDAIVPGGAASTPDTEVLKKYLALREEDVAALTRQLKLAQERNQALEQELAVERARGAELSHQSDSRRQRIEGFERETAVLMESRDREIAELSLQVKTKNDRLRLLEIQLQEAKDEGERMREKVRADLRRIRVRERELENRIEVMKRDQEALISSREARLGELKRRTDLLEFNNELLNEQLTQERKVQEQLRNQLAKVAQAVRAAGGLLQVNETMGESSSDGQSGEGEEAGAALSLDAQSRQNRVAS